MRSWMRPGAITILIAIHVALLAWGATLHSPTTQEIGHVPAGISHWQYQTFDLYKVNPPLPRMIAVVPLLGMEPETDWSNYRMDAFAREDVPMAIRFATANGSRIFWLFTVARWACIPFSLLGAWVCYRWASDLWGEAAGLTALILWSFSPIILGNGPLVMPDVPAAALGLTASYLYWRWLRRPTWWAAFAAGAGLGLACLSKTTLLLFFAIWPILYVVDRFFCRSASSDSSRLQHTLMASATAFVAFYVINMGYGFNGSLRPLGSFQFQSQLLCGSTNDSATSGNRFAGTWLGHLPSPVPADFLQGVDRQRRDFELGDWSYLRGEWKQGGWWYYHLYALAIKTPPGTWLILLTAVALTICAKSYRASMTDEFCLLLPAVAILTLVSSQTGFSNHMRYTIPALPFLFIWMSKIAYGFQWRIVGPSMLAVFGVAATVISSLAVYPHPLSYFNVFAGGPKHGHEHLLDSNIAWGQDHLFLKEWLEKHPEAQPLHLAAFGWIEPQLLGIEFRLPPTAPELPDRLSESGEASEWSLQPGWYVIDVNFLHGTHWPAASGEGTWKVIPPEGPNYCYFRHFTPVDRIGYSMYVYHLTSEDINREFYQHSGSVTQTK